MNFKSFLLSNLVSLCMKIINSVITVGLYYGFLTTLSVGPSYLLRIQAQVMEEGEEGKEREKETEKKVAAITGFFMGQLIMFISFYYTPLHLALDRPHTITILVLPYLLCHFFWNNQKCYMEVDYGSTSRNSIRNLCIRNLSIQCIFLNNLIFQLFNHFIFPNSVLARLINIYMFRCNNKILFVTSSFVGWLMGQTVWMKCLDLIIVWIQQKRIKVRFFRSKKYIRSQKYLAAKFNDNMGRIFSILFLITCLYYLGRMPSPLFTKKLNHLPETTESETETEVKIEKLAETKETKQEEEGFTEEEPSPSLFSDEKLAKEEKQIFGVERPPYSLLFDYKRYFIENLFDPKRWNRPTRYIKNEVRIELSQFFFHTCQNDGQKRISFTYPPSLSIFGEMLKRKISDPKLEKFFNAAVYNSWIAINEKKKKSLIKEFAKRIAAIDKGIDALDKKMQLCNEKTKKEYLPKRTDPFLNGPYRGIRKRKKGFSPSIRIKTAVQNWIDAFVSNKIYRLFSNDYNYHELEQKKELEQKQDALKKIISKESKPFMPFISSFAGVSIFDREERDNFPLRQNFKDHQRISKFLVDAIIGFQKKKKAKAKKTDT